MARDSVNCELPQKHATSVRLEQFAAETAKSKHPDTHVEYVLKLGNAVVVDVPVAPPVPLMLNEVTIVKTLVPLGPVLVERNVSVVGIGV